MELVYTLPHICACTFYEVFLLVRIIGHITMPDWIADISMTFKKTQVPVLGISAGSKNEQSSSGEKRDE
jgi:hypothetical protein